MQAEDFLAGTFAAEHIGIELVAYPALHISQLFPVGDVVLGLREFSHLYTYIISNSLDFVTGNTNGKTQMLIKIKVSWADQWGLKEKGDGYGKFRLFIFSPLLLFIIEKYLESFIS